uniref:Uncharacterized LOC107091935 n=2 Tax=Cyprinodon variegatus TaxID=28743 RepID=A0A3Q2EBV2_CYPVA
MTVVLKLSGVDSVPTRSVPPETKVVGENISIHCPVDESRKLEFLYFQKIVDKQDRIFYNGYHSSKPLEPMPNTKMDPKNTIMHMFGLKLSNSGTYECSYKYKHDKNPVNKKLMHLNVTAFFTKPVITHRCGNENGIPLECDVQCDSYNGLPGKEISWDFKGNITKDRWKVSNRVRDPSSTELVNISSTATINCSGGEVFAFCFIDDSMSNVSVCSPKAPPEAPPTMTIAVIAATVVCGLVGVLLLMICLILRRRNTCTETEAARNVIEESIHLNCV